MKKWMTLLLCCVLALNLTACGAGAPGGPEDNAPPQASVLHFEVATQIYENEYKADDGTVLIALHERRRVLATHLTAVVEPHQRKAAVQLDYLSLDHI